MPLVLPYLGQQVVLTVESFDLPQSDARSTDHVGTPEAKYFFGDVEVRTSSRHRISVQAGDAILASRVLLATGGATGVHDHSAVVCGDTCFVAVGPFVCALELPTLELLWHKQVDSATCFGVYDAPGYAGLICHGELELARLSYAGELVWSAGGRDIFSEGFVLHEHHAEAIDFESTRYRVELATGRIVVV